MTLTNLVDNVGSRRARAFGEANYTSIVAGTPIPTLLRPLKEYSDSLRNDIVAYDAATLGLTSVDAIIESLATDLAETGENVDQKYVTVPNEQAEMLVSGLNQAQSVLGQNKPYVGLTSVSGLLYNIRIEPENQRILSINEQGEASLVGYYDAEIDAWRIMNIWPSAISPVINQVPYNVSNVVYQTNAIAALDNLDVNEYTIASLVTVLVNSKTSEPASQYTIIDAYRELASYYTSDDTSEYTVQQCIQACLAGRIPSATGVSSSDARESVAVLANGLAVSATINQTMIECIDSLSSCSFSKWIQNATTWISDKHASVKKFVRRISTAYAQGGFKGVISTLYNILKGQASITDKDGVLVFTDNAKLLPAEYIVGMVSQVFSVISTVVSSIIAVVVPILGAIAGLIGNIFWGVIGSAKKDKSDTRCSIPQSEDEDEENIFNFIPYAPFSIFQGVCSTTSIIDNFAWYRDYYEQTGNCAMVEVPGGCLFLGPGEFTGSNKSKRMSKIRWEFHPYGLALNRPAVREALGIGTESPLIDRKQRSGESFYFIKQLSAKQAWLVWKDILSKSDSQNLNAVNEQNTGVVSEDNDKYLRGSIIFSIMMFMQWIQDTTVGTVRNAPDRYDGVYFALHGPSGMSLDTPTEYGHIRSYYMHFLFDNPYGSGGDEFLSHTSTGVASWKDIIKFCEDGSKGTINDFWYWAFYTFSTEGQLSTSTFSLFLDVHTGEGLPLIMQDLVPEAEAKYLNIGNSCALPFNPVYAVNPPKYNAQTFWKWIALSSLAVAATTTLLVVGAVKWTKWKTTERLKSIATTNSNREDYINATQGLKTVTNPETGKVETVAFDPSSDEGKAYVKSCLKNYKSSVFKANLKANIIGGTRFDKTSYYGDADTSADKTSIKDMVQNKFLGVTTDTGSDLSEGFDVSTTEIDLSQVTKLIVGTPA